MNQEPDAYTLTRPPTPTLPVVVDVPHAGEWIPRSVTDEMVVGDQTLRRDLDLYVDQIWQDAPSMGASLLSSNVSRYVVDLNRADDDVSPQTVKGGVRLQKPGYYHERGVVWRSTTDGTPVMRGPMSAEAFARRIATFHTPYHKALAEEIERVRQIFGFCILLDGHSMPSQGRQGHSDPGSRRADIVPGDVMGTSCAGSLTSLVCSTYREAGMSVKPNTPYQGGWITRHYGKPEDNVHAIQIEINRALYMNERTFVQIPQGMHRLRMAANALLEALQGFEP